MRWVLEVWDVKIYMEMAQHWLVLCTGNSARGSISMILHERKDVVEDVPFEVPVENGIP